MRYLLPAGMACAEQHGEEPLSALFPAEASVIVGAVASRQAEFATGRVCARRALARLGFAPLPILRDAHRAPRWPMGVVGSITHCGGYRAAVVARRRTVRAVGIDAEPHEALPGGLIDAVSVPQERAHLAALVAARPEVHWDRLLFSAKESVYKMWYSLTGERLDFDDACLAFQPDPGTFTVSLGEDDVAGRRAATNAVGRWAVRDGLIRTACTTVAS